MKFAEILSATAIKKQTIESIAGTRIQQQVYKFRHSRFGLLSATVTTGIKRWVKFERLIAVTCSFFPFLLILVNGWPTEGKESISAYYIMNEQRHLWAFYFPLTIAVMLFIVNGLVKSKAWYNIYLGVMLSGVVLFNHVDFKIVHGIFAVFFFVGNVLVIKFAKTGFFKNPKDELIFDTGLIIVIALSLLLFVSHRINLFYLEWISFVMISVHFLLLSIGTAVDIKGQKVTI